jgi:hypothetical protein
MTIPKTLLDRTPYRLLRRFNTKNLNKAATLKNPKPKKKWGIKFVRGKKVKQGKTR